MKDLCKCLTVSRVTCALSFSISVSLAWIPDVSHDLRTLTINFVCTALKKAQCLSLLTSCLS